MNDNSVYSRNFDPAFSTVKELAWLPWVGVNYPARAESERLLLVGESHYVKPTSADQLEAELSAHRYGEYTREIIEECPVNGEWSSKTLDAIPKVLFGTGEIHRTRFWGDTAYYNFVQRPMYYTREGGPERPDFTDLVTGWKAFLKVVDILQPSHCLFLGVGASNCFEPAMQALYASYSGYRRTHRINRTYAREASLLITGRPVDLCFIKHPGKYFSWDAWHKFLQAREAGFTGWLSRERYCVIGEN